MDGRNCSSQRRTQKLLAIAQWFATGGLWWTWLSHDMANIAVFLPREVPLDLMFLVSAVFVVGLFFMFRERGGKIQSIVLEKHNTRYVRSATLIDLFYWLCLYFFKELNDIPMSTTWVFVGMLAGRELAIASFTGKMKFKSVFPLVARDFQEDDDMDLGASSSNCARRYIIVLVPNGF